MAEWPYNTANWQKLRKLHLSHYPFCEGCKAMGRPHIIANTVDHVVPISEGGPAFPGIDGLRSYCPACHSAKTARGVEAGAARTTKPRRGCDANGNPLDANHAWAKFPETSDAKIPKTLRKSLRAGERRARGDTNIELVSNSSISGISDGR